MIFLDTNILIDFADSKRSRHNDTVELLRTCTSQRVVMTTSVLCVGTFCYLLESRAKLSSPEIKNWLLKLSQLLSLIPTDKLVLQYSAESKFTDVEDAILYYSALSNDCEAFITNNVRDFPSNSNLPVFTPQLFLDQLE